ncbi:MAG: hypothetical protein COV41_01945 [Candidatus Brennerbacteria bacterium CG11_big_fil_rev_8_21_14_0_20_43_10]|uniref:Uncharacterized protein n=1 Tax=Candidatus Brennerbacteria bacterium CG11_big_fil_rev_8_21_14_0_20_43_10 TaxID=1974523 RepID=A0A2H0PVY6_9BACT|nr:MAG: hypothetical protein COV41_01945 [Candidatus Brennerbacteria bacterium CG11_big_fil_rev_8_21_14_0_20_43_10]
MVIAVIRPVLELVHIVMLPQELVPILQLGPTQMKNVLALVPVAELVMAQVLANTPAPQSPVVVYRIVIT